MFGVGSTYQWMGSRAMNVELCSLDGGREGLAHQRERVVNFKIGRDLAARTHYAGNRYERCSYFWPAGSSWVDAVRRRVRAMACTLEPRCCML